MKTFKNYLLNKNNFILSWDSGHAEQRDENITEEVTNTTHEEVWGKHVVHKNNKYNKRDGCYNGDIHDHPDVKPKGLTNRDSVIHYAETPSDHYNGHGSSKNINGYLRNRMGDKKVGIIEHQTESVLDSVKKLSSNFTPENVNRKELTSYSGVPEHIGKKLEASKSGDIHHLAGFTSTSTAPHTAVHFAKNAAMETDNPHIHHIIKFTVQSGAGMSIAHESSFGENEILLHHGAKTTYSHTEINHGRSDNLPDAPKVETHIHHVTVHPEHKNLDDYGSYNAPKD